MGLTHNPALPVFSGIVIAYFGGLSWTLTLALLAVAAACAGGIVYRNRILAKAEENAGIRKLRARRQRNMSFISELCARGAYPSAYHIPQPIINGVLYFDNLPSVDKIKLALKDGLLPYLRFRASAVIDTEMGKATFEETEVDLDKHIFEISVENDIELMEHIDRQTVSDLRVETGRPLWEVHVVRNKSGGSVLVGRVHHAIGDGLSLVSVFMSLFTDANGEPISLPAFTRPHRSRASLLSKVRGAITMAWRFLRALAKVLHIPVSAADSPHSFRDNTTPWRWTGRRRTVLFPRVELATIKAIKNASHGSTVNDVMTSLLAGTIRRYLELQDDSLLSVRNGADIHVRALLPYAFPRKSGPVDKEEALRNLWCFISLRMPVEVPSSDPVGRLRTSKARLDYIKRSPEAHVQLSVQELASSVLPFEVQAQTGLDLISKHSVTFTNVPGPSTRIYFAGEPMRDFQCVIGHITNMASAFSYNGHVSFNIVVDDSIVKDHAKLPELFLAELSALKAALNVQ